MLSGEQIRAARALLGWSQSKLAEAAGVGEMTIKRFEARTGSIGGTVTSALRLKTALENAGIEFIDADDRKGPGVRLARP